MAHRGVLAPLFDRIVRQDSGAGAQFYLDEKGVRESILNELAIMLNNRCTVRRVEYDRHVQDIVIYGMPDFLGMPEIEYDDPTNPDAWPIIEDRIETTIRAVEPRVSDVSVKVLRFDGVEQELVVDIRARVCVQDKNMDITFPLAISQRT